MISIELLVVLLAGTLFMCIPIAVQMKWYRIARWKSIVVSTVLVLTGVIGSEIWFFIENLSFGGRSLYGAVFFAPFVFLPVAKFLRIPYSDTMDFVAPAGCLTLALVKIQCLRDGCCQGMILYINEEYMYVRFPSQISELCAFLVISVALFLHSMNEKNRRTIFPKFLIFYGATRFVLNFFRGEEAIFAFGLPAGNVWSLLSVIIGAVWLTVQRRRLDETK